MQNQSNGGDQNETTADSNHTNEPQVETRERLPEDAATSETTAEAPGSGEAVLNRSEGVAETTPGEQEG